MLLSDLWDIVFEYAQTSPAHQVLIPALSTTRRLKQWGYSEYFSQQTIANPQRLSSLLETRQNKTQSVNKDGRPSYCVMCFSKISILVHFARQTSTPLWIKQRCYDCINKEIPLTRLARLIKLTNCLKIASKIKAQRLVINRRVFYSINDSIEVVLQHLQSRCRSILCRTKPKHKRLTCPCQRFALSKKRITLQTMLNRLDAVCLRRAVYLFLYKKNAVE